MSKNIPNEKKLVDNKYRKLIMEFEEINENELVDIIELVEINENEFREIEVCLSPDGTWKDIKKE